MFLKDFGMMDEADIRLVIDDSNQKPVWTGGGENLPSPEILAQAKKVLLVINAGDGIITEEIESTLSAFRKLTPTDALFLYTMAEDESISGKRMELYVK
jgi:hypothetical protein